MFIFSDMSLEFYKITAYGNYFFFPCWATWDDFVEETAEEFSLFLKNNKRYFYYEQIGFILHTKGWVSKEALALNFDQRSVPIFSTSKPRQKIFDQLDALLSEMIKKGFIEKRKEKWNF